MHSVAIRDLKNNPASMTKYLEAGESVFVTKHGKPLGITIPFSEEMLAMGMMKTIALEQYRQGLISVGKMAELMGIKKQEAVKLLSDLKIDWLGYTKSELDEQEKILEKLL
jgi:antitoxin (DNA-binding transcriptional repressor) of toxin-antitoxin stability system